MNQLLKFKSDYEFNEIFYISEKDEIFYIPDDKNDESHIFELIEKKNKKKLLLICDSGDQYNLFGFKRIDIVASTPSAEMACLVLGNIAYLVNCKEPLSYKLVSDQPVKEILQDLENNLLLLFYSDRLVTYGNSENKEFVFSDIVEQNYNITNIYKNTIELSYYDLAWGKDRIIRLDLKDKTIVLEE